MLQTLNFYRTLNERLLEELGATLTYSYKYFKNGSEHTLESVLANKKNFSFGDQTEWNPYDFDLKICIDIEILHPNILYGANGIAPTNSKIGIFLEFYSQRSRKRNLITLDGHISRRSEKQVISYEYILPKNVCDNVLDVNVALYLKEQSTSLLYKESTLNNDLGIILGILDSKSIYLTGNGAVFPIFISQLGKNSELWVLDTLYDNPATCQLTDSFRITLNANHKDFIYLDETRPVKYCRTLVNEIVCDAVALLLLKLKQEGYTDDIEVSEIEQGSLLEFVVYAKNVLELDFEDPIKLSKSIRKLVEEREKHVI